MIALRKFSEAVLSTAAGMVGIRETSFLEIEIQTGSIEEEEHLKVVEEARLVF